ncbi:hypothetical protein FRB99_005258 [Tulasnella sp. 403]|nr:hypothetical protein FRB99_005258 [Tulasnella sp. 403]
MLSNLNSDARSSVERADGSRVPAPSHNAPNRHSSVQGHIKHPVLAREPSALESIRTITNTLRTLPAVFSPATKNAPGTSPPSQQRSTALSYGSFVTPANVPLPLPVTPTTVINDGPAWSPLVSPSPDPQHYSVAHVPQGHTPPQVSQDTEGERVTWAAWDQMQTTSGTRRLLLLGYFSGLQIWDITSIDALQEILNVNITSFIASEGVWNVSRALVLPTPPRHHADEFAEARPLLAVVARESSHPTQTGPTEVLIYSLRTHTVVKRLGTPQLDDPKFGIEPSSADSNDSGEDLYNVAEISANLNFVIISTQRPLAIHILSASNLHIIYSISHESLTPSHSNGSHPSHPIYSLSSRFLAFASPPPLPHHRVRHAVPGSSVASGNSGFSPTLNAIGAGGMELVGSGAKKVGEGVLMGVKALSSFAFGTNPTPPAPQPPIDAHGTFFSRSAPTGPMGADLSPSGLMAASPGLTPMSPRQMGVKTHRSPVGTLGESVLNPPVESGYVTILDLMPLCQSNRSVKSGAIPSTHPVQIAHFLATAASSSVIPSTSTHGVGVQSISFSPSGTMLCVCDVHGHVAKVFQIRGGVRGLRGVHSWTTAQETSVRGNRRSSAGGGRTSFESRRRSSGGSSASSNSTVSGRGNLYGGDAIWHMYDLVRGATNGKIESISWSFDARWLGVGTNRGTLHVFGINPYGGKPDELSHLEGRVRNPSTLQAWPVTVYPCVRLKATAREGFVAPLFQFISPTLSKSSAILSPSIDRKPSSLPVSRSISTPSGDSRATLHPGFQDILTFASPTGLLSLRRCVVYPAMSDPHNDPKNVAANARRGTGASGVSLMMGLVGSSTAQDAGMRASENLVASWDLKRDKSWDEVKDVIKTPADDGKGGRRSLGRADTLSQAELSTSSTSPHILPPSVYLSHQFNFFALCEDWHALLRQSHLDLPIRKIDVRKEVEISPLAHPVGIPGSVGSKTIQRSEEHEVFVQDMDITHDISTSFEKPIASAMHSNLDAQPIPGVIPSFPNAYKPSSWRDSIVPVRSVAAGVADGVNEGIGRIKREITKARGPSSKKPHERPQHEAPSLVFETDDEEIFNQDHAYAEAAAGDGATERRDSQSGQSGSTPSTSTNLETDPGRGNLSDDAWEEKEDEIANALAEEARFDEISGSGFAMEEEEERLRLKEQVAGTRGGKGKGRSGKKAKRS